MGNETSLAVLDTALGAERLAYLSEPELNALAATSPQLRAMVLRLYRQRLEQEFSYRDDKGQRHVLAIIPKLIRLWGLVEAKRKHPPSDWFATLRQWALIGLRLQTMAVNSVLWGHNHRLVLESVVALATNRAGRRMRYGTIEDVRGRLFPWPIDLVFQGERTWFESLRPLTSEADLRSALTVDLTLPLLLGRQSDPTGMNAGMAEIVVGHPDGWVVTDAGVRFGLNVSDPSRVGDVFVTWVDVDSVWQSSSLDALSGFLYRIPDTLDLSRVIQSASSPTEAATMRVNYELTLRAGNGLPRFYLALVEWKRRVGDLDALNVLQALTGNQRSPFSSNVQRLWRLLRDGQYKVETDAKYLETYGPLLATLPGDRNPAQAAMRRDRFVDLSSAGPHWDDRQGFAALRRTAGTDHRVAAWQRVHERYPTVYHYIFFPWDDMAVYRPHDRPNELVSISKARKSELRQAMPGWQAYAQVWPQMMRPLGVVKARFGHLQAPLQLVEVVDPDLLVLADGHAKCVLRSYEGTMGQRIQATLSVQSLLRDWPLAATLNLATLVDVMVAPADVTAFMAGTAWRPPSDDEDIPWSLHTWMLEPYAEVHLLDVLLGKPTAMGAAPEHPRWSAFVVASLFQARFALRAAWDLLALTLDDFGEKNLMFCDMTGTPYANRPWAYRFRGQDAYWLVPADVHRNWLVKVIDFGEARVGAAPRSDEKAEMRRWHPLARQLLRLLVLGPDASVYEDTLARSMAAGDETLFFTLFGAVEKSRGAEGVLPYRVLDAGTGANVPLHIPVLVGFIPDDDEDVSIEDADRRPKHPRVEEEEEPPIPKRLRLEHAAPLGWSDRRGFAGIQETSATEARIRLLDDLRRQYPNLYRFSVRWYDGDDPNRQVYLALRTLQRTLHQFDPVNVSPEELEAARAYLTDGASITTRVMKDQRFVQWFAGLGNMSDTAALGYAWANVDDVAFHRDLGRCFVQSAGLAQDESRSKPELMRVRLTSALFRRACYGMEEALLRLYDLANLEESDRMALTMAVLTLQWQWPLAVTHNLGTLVDFFIRADPGYPDEYPLYSLMAVELFAEWSLKKINEALRDQRLARLPMAPTPAFLLASLFQGVAAVSAGRLVGFAHRDIHPGQLLFANMQGTPFADRPWAFRFRDDCGYYLVDPVVHQNWMVKLIDFDLGEAWDDPRQPRTLTPYPLEPYPADTRISHQADDIRRLVWIVGLWFQRSVDTYVSKDDPRGTLVERAWLRGPWTDWELFHERAMFQEFDAVRWVHGDPGVLPLHVFEARGADAVDKTTPILVGFIPDADTEVKLEFAPAHKRPREEDVEEEIVFESSDEEAEPDAKRTRL